MVDGSSWGEGSNVKNGKLRFVLEELLSVRSFEELGELARKASYFTAYLRRLPGHAGRLPLSLQIEPTNHCNINCICCSRDSMSRERGFMDMGLFRKIIDDSADCGIRRIHLYLHGEPFMHPRLEEMIRYAKGRGLGITIATNGTMLDGPRAEAVLSSGMNKADHILFSVLGYSKQVHESIMRGVRHEEVLDNLFTLLELRRKRRARGPVLEVVFYLMQENESEGDLFNVYWRQFVDHVRIEGISHQFAASESLSSSLPVRKKTCTHLWQRMTVFWNGDVTSCIADVNGVHVFGNLENETIKEMWSKPYIMTIRQNHSSKKFCESLCYNCDW